jgi:hypothetical protein
MPPVVFLALLGAAGVAGYRILSTLLEARAPRGKNTGEMRRAAAPVRDLGNLEWDESAGVYRPRSQRDN